VKAVNIRPLGLMTQPNKLGTAPLGSMSEAANVMFRRPNTMEPFTAFQDYTAAASSGLLLASASRVRAMFPCDMSTLCAIGATDSLYSNATSLRWVTHAATSAVCQFNLGGTPQNPSLRAGAARMARTRGRSIVNNFSHPIVFDTEGSLAPRLVGMPIAVGVFGSVYGSPSGGFDKCPPYSHARYVCAFFKRQADGYEIIGAPSTPFLLENSSAIYGTPVVYAVWSTKTQLSAGCVIRFYRTPYQPSGTDPGEEFFQVSEHTITGGDLTPVASVWFPSESMCTGGLFNDNSDDTELNNPIYTNPSEDGAVGANYAPAQCDDVCMFRGAALYVGRRGTQAFSLTVPTHCGGTVTATRPVGVHVAAGDFTNGNVNVVGIASTAGLEAGQLVNDGLTYVQSGTRVISVAAHSIVMSLPATLTIGAHSFNAIDVIEINGVAIRAFNMLDLATTVVVAQTSLDVKGAGTLGANNGGTIELLSHVPYNDAASSAADGTFTIAATNGSYYSPALPALDATPLYSSGDPRDNRVFYSKVQQPEHVPLLNYFDVGHGTILKLEAIRDAVFAFCTDGIYRITGDGVNWRVDPYDLGTVLLCAAATGTLGDVVYAWTNKGLTSVGHAGVTSVSQDFIGNDLRTLWESVSAAPYASGSKVITPLQYSWIMRVACDKYHNEVWMTAATSDAAQTPATACYVLNTDQNAWSFYNQEVPTCIEYADYLRSILINRNEMNGAGGTGNNVNIVRYFRPDGEDPTTLKEWMDVELLYDGLTGYVTCNVTYPPNGSYLGDILLAPAASGDVSTRLAVPRGANYTPEFSMRVAHSSGAAVPWKFYGFSLRYREVAEQGAR
jgi:hypothetical protein